MRKPLSGIAQPFSPVIQSELPEIPATLFSFMRLLRFGTVWNGRIFRSIRSSYPRA